MQDPNWELINGEAAHEIEYINYSNQVNVIEALTILFLTLYQPGAEGCPASPNAMVLREMHRTGTLFLLSAPGHWRTVEVNVYKGGQIVHACPKWEDVPGLMEGFDAEILALWPKEDAIGIAAYALWRINWIHPFKNGNGRSARAFAYACMCLKSGAFLPGTVTVLDLIMMNRDPYEAALKAADESYEKIGVADLSLMKAYLSELLTQQLVSVVGAPDASEPDMPDEAAPAQEQSGVPEHDVPGHSEEVFPLSAKAGS